MPEVGPLIEFLAGFWSSAFAIAAGVYAATTWFGRHHLSQESKDSLTLWLWGDYESTWSHQICNFFDAVFGRRHLSWRCFLASSIASVLAVTVLYVLLAVVLDIKGDRALGELELWEAILFALAINIVADYLSLFETRWLLRRFQHVRSVFGQLGMLVADALLTAAIIWLFINAFHIAIGLPALSVIDMVGVFSVFALFFYSTFATSLWVWIYCISTWFMRLFSRTALKGILDVEKNPMAQVALVGSVLIFITSLVLTPVLRPGGPLDDLLCTFSDEAGVHVARSTENLEQANRCLSKVCEGAEDETCYALAKRYLEEDESLVFEVWENGCKAGQFLSCNNLGNMQMRGYPGRPGRPGRDPDPNAAANSFEKACPAAEDQAGICHLCAGAVVEVHNGDEPQQSYPNACRNLTEVGHAFAGGIIMGEGDVLVNWDRAGLLFCRACCGGNAEGCTVAGLRQVRTNGNDPDYRRAAQFLEAACELGEARGCSALGELHENGLGMPRNIFQAIEYYQKACDGSYQKGCELRERACELESTPGCDVVSTAE